MIHVVMGLIINKEGLILVAQRGQHQPQAGIWEVPGGKVESGEAALAALQRELKEEIGIEVTQATPWIKIPYHHSNNDMLYDVWLIDQFRGKITGLEGQSLHWVNRNEFISLLGFPDNEADKVGDRLNAILKHRTLCDDDANFHLT
ncbi:NUDIX domain-containing protein [Legionella sp. MW5194]|uniref:NUDIX domain-containing protein n=1 Tax=Legionella sp. MW5194 TaxID=2662448 RepID=UPI00193D8E27|nr:NUDIX domain-containing protein [Legionella sp. MW5194]QRN03317.1 NUDIX domain-containing protein [Legionella sp. MW5194]